VPALITWWKLDIGELAPDAHYDAVAAIGADLVRRLGESHRRYHTSLHLVEMFWALEELEEAGVIDAREGVVARVAAWFHDAVYDPAAVGGGNEAASAALAVRDLGALGAEPEDVEAVRDLVLATEQHLLPEEKGLRAAFHDADLWILSAPEDRFDEYCGQVREEYAAVPDRDFARGRAAVLHPFLHREAIYATAHARDSWGHRARVNLGRELARLGG
jgi:predicted metal-dependent HD superfamily phosphohydrolase